MNYFLVSNKVMTIQEIEESIPWERDIYFNQHKTKIEESKSRNG